MEPKWNSYLYNKEKWFLKIILMNLLFKSNKNYYIKFILPLTSLSFMLLVLVKSSVSQFSFDEAYTFMQYVYTDNIFNVGIANNHLLNTVLMYFFSFIGNSEFILRLPNIIFSCAYFLVSYFVSRKLNYPILSLSIFYFAPYLIDFFSIARGYGISASLVFIGIVNFYNSESKYSIHMSMLCFLLSAYSIHITVIVLFFFILFNIEYFLKNINLLNILSIFIIGFSSIPIIFLVFNITGSEKPLYGIDEVSIFYLLTSSFGFIDLYVTKSILIHIILNSLFFSPIIFFNMHSLKSKKIILISYSTFISLYLLPFIFDKPYPVYRVLTPFLPLMLVMVVISLNIALIRLKKKQSMAVRSIIVLSLCINFLVTLQIDRYYDWEKVYDKSIQIAFRYDVDEGTCFFLHPDELRDPTTDYYRLQASLEQPIYCNYDTGRVMKNSG